MQLNFMINVMEPRLTAERVYDHFRDHCLVQGRAA